MVVAKTAILPLNTKLAITYAMGLPFFFLPQSLLLHYGL